MKTNIPPMAPGNFFFGHIRNMQKNPLDFLLKISQQNDKVVRLDFGIRKVYFLCDPMAVHEVLQVKSKNYSKDTPASKLLKEFLGEGLFTSEGKIWQEQRRFLQPDFNKNSVEKLIPIISEMTNQWTLQILSKVKHDPTLQIDICKEMEKLSLAILAKALFNTDITDDLESIAVDFKNFSKEIHRLSTGIFNFSIFKKIHHKRSIKKIKDTANKIIASRLAQTDSSEDLMSHLIKCPHNRDKKSALTEDTLTFLAVGSETTATALSWSWYLLARNQTAYQLLKQESVTSTGGNFSRMVFLESMRVYPPGWKIGRRAINNDRICGYDIPANALILISPWALHRNSLYWENPEEFRPERFLKENSFDRHHYIPFGAGPHICIGNHLAILIAQIVLNITTSKMTFELTSPNEVIPVPMISLHPKGEIWARVIPH